MIAENLGSLQSNHSEAGYLVSLRRSWPRAEPESLGGDSKERDSKEGDLVNKTPAIGEVSTGELHEVDSVVFRLRDSSRKVLD